MAPEKDINRIKLKIEDLKKRFPAHSLKGHMFAELEDLEDELKVLVMKLRLIQGEKK